ADLVLVRGGQLQHWRGVPVGHRLTRQVFVLPAAAATMLGAGPPVTLARPTGELGRPRGLQARYRRTPRALAGLLRSHNLRPPVHERLIEQEFIRPRDTRTDPVVVRGAPERPVRPLERLPAVLLIRDDTV